MSAFCARNITGLGRWLRGLMALGFLAAGVGMFPRVWWVGVLLLGAGAFGAWEALRGWCLLRACGIKTRF